MCKIQKHLFASAEGLAIISGHTEQGWVHPSKAQDSLSGAGCTFAAKAAQLKLWPDPGEPKSKEEVEMRRSKTEHAVGWGIASLCLGKLTRIFTV